MTLVFAWYRTPEHSGTNPISGYEYVFIYSLSYYHVYKKEHFEGAYYPHSCCFPSFYRTYFCALSLRKKSNYGNVRYLVMRCCCWNMTYRYRACCYRTCCYRNWLITKFAIWNLQSFNSLMYCNEANSRTMPKICKDESSYLYASASYGAC